MSTVTLVLAFLFLAYHLSLVANGWWNSRRAQEFTIVEGPAPAPAPSTSIIIPARNEEDAIERCVTSFAAQDYPGRLEIIVVNDRSTDRTGEILARVAKALPNVVVIDGVEPPAGWTGKIHALHQGQARAMGEWLVFADADTRHEPSSVRSCIAHALARENDVLCVIPRRDLAVPSEKILLPMALHLFELQSPLARANDPRSPESACVGQLILATRAAYDRLGGWESVKDDVMDDRAFGQRAKAPSSGVRYGKADGARVSSVRLYESLADVWEGGTKTNWHRTWPLALLPFAVLASLALGVGPFALAALAAVHPHPWFAPVALAQLGLFAIVWGQAVRRAGIALPWALLQPLAYPFTAASILVAGVQLATGRGVRWKGRRYS